MLIVKAAYLIMREFLEEYYCLTGSFDVGALLGDTMLLEDGSTADPAAWEDWLQAIKSAEISLIDDIYMSEADAYKTIVAFLHGYGHRIHSKEIFRLIKEMNEE